MEKRLGQELSSLFGLLVMGFVVFLVAAFAEAGRLPFDLPECEQELVGGFHTEYSGMKLVLFLTAEFIHMITAASNTPVPTRTPSCVTPGRLLRPIMKKAPAVVTAAHRMLGATARRTSAALQSG